MPAALLWRSRVQTAPQPVTLGMSCAEAVHCCASVPRRVNRCARSDTVLLAEACCASVSVLPGLPTSLSRLATAAAAGLTG